MRISVPLLALALVLPLGATTLLKVSMGDLITHSTSIVRAKIGGFRTAVVGQDIYTYYQLQVSETLKQGATVPAEVAVPGGVSGTRRQIGVGSPVLTPGQEYVLFLWTSPKGLTQMVGLSQGLFTLRQDSTGATVVDRTVISDAMVDKTGKPVADAGLTMKWSDLQALIAKTLKPAAVK